MDAPNPLLNDDESGTTAPPPASLFADPETTRSLDRARGFAGLVLVVGTVVGFTLLFCEAYGLIQKDLNDLDEKLLASDNLPALIAGRGFLVASVGGLLYAILRSGQSLLMPIHAHVAMKEKKPESGDFIVPGPDPTNPKMGVTRVVEAFGDFWHSRMFTGKAPFDHEQELVDAYAEIGVTCLVLWESEVKPDPESVRPRLMGFLG